MYFLDPIYKNTIGETFLLKDDRTLQSDLEKIHLQLGSVAILLEQKELKTLLILIIKTKHGCTCKNCNEKHIPKSIKFDTHFSQVLFKSTKTNLVALEHLLKRTIFELELSSILNSNNIPT
ncbi:hypothetical protein FNB79_10670 [Formosa sediminum]|uniref:Uncharacterized protein n=1 Tax=Formosa sediminum TaxID=2594004 RepID=A0A516GSB4_9FLAO|nr:hypothetical protein [Formosa sediminum]QDO94404.1 hypothetical protein FNB79_10670 [Formosa sediminum]